MNTFFLFIITTNQRAIQAFRMFSFESNLLFTPGRHNLADGNASVIRGDPEMRIRAEVIVAQTANGALGQSLVLKTSSRQNDLLLFKATGDGHDYFGQRIMKPGRDPALLLTVLEIIQDLPDHQLPVNDERG